ncbi:hypothetical protein [Nostoc sp.]|uniref:hypothetical protein n=1 Tax=Nostoc sp. TaxID=1180 RepID=UPI002FFCA625
MDFSASYLDKFFNTEETIVGIVFRENLREMLEKHFTEVRAGENTAILPDALQVPHICFYGIRVFFDAEQLEDCLIFEDKELLQNYLNRRSNEEFRMLARAKSALNSEQKPISPMDYPIWGWGLPKPQE